MLVGAYSLDGSLSVELVIRSLADPNQGSRTRMLPWLTNDNIRFSRSV